ncbi:toll/interleukin-1 receptor domain-containing protein [Aquimarina pacifica]|uniref:toll/interleukin-1 receptor domain-containing protein n=1 Tax=Aquimarina pacifica TaxID=1296415 RepID=UPI00046FEDCD|nr:toll/interleukin-1 receptor domain-containing protein [Aquimarina pacifica]
MERNGVFISYSKKDAKWLDYLRVHLSYLEREYKFTIWEDSKIEVGAEWRKEIHKALSSTKVAILLVSANFISSDFINNEELPALLSAAEDEGAYIFPIIVSYCMFHDISALSKFQTINRPSEPLTIMNEGQRDALFTKVTKEIKRVLSLDTSIVNSADREHLLTTKELRLSFIRVEIMTIFHSNGSVSDVGLSIKDVCDKSIFKKRKEVVSIIHDLEALKFLDKTKVNKVGYYSLTKLGHKFIKEHHYNV